MQKVEPGQIPLVMQQLLGKYFTVTLELNEDNVKFGSNVYEACDLALGFFNIDPNTTASQSNDTSATQSFDTSSKSLKIESEDNIKKIVSFSPCFL